jgi:hypothetical protein
MSDWSFLVPPDVGVTLRARTRPALLARCLGDETAPVAHPALLIDFTAAADGAGALVRGRYKGVPWRCLVEQRDGGRRIAFRSPLLREYLTLHIALLPALRRLLLERDVALVTGATFVKNGGATVLTGLAGSGKTAALLAMLANGAQLIGDEYAGISGAGEVTPVLRVIALRRAALGAAPELSQRLTPTRRLMLRAAVLGGALSMRRLDPLVHVSPGELGLTSKGSATPLSRLVWLERSAGGPRRAPMDTAQAIDALRRALEAHDTAYGVSAALAIDSSRWRETLARGLRDVECARVTLPLRPLAPEAIRDLIGAARVGPST